MKARLILLGVAIASVVAAIGTSPASAYTYSNTLRPGTATTYQTTGEASWGDTIVNSGPIYAYRSLASTEMQKVTIRWKLWSTYAGNTWVSVADVSHTYDVYPGQHAFDPGWTYTDWVKGYFATEFTITWTTPTGTLLGRTFRNYNQSGDYKCLDARVCDSGWIAGQYTLLIH